MASLLMLVVASLCVAQYPMVPPEFETLEFNDWLAMKLREKNSSPLPNLWRVNDINCSKHLCPQAFVKDSYFCSKGIPKWITDNFYRAEGISDASHPLETAETARKRCDKDTTDHVWAPAEIPSWEGEAVEIDRIDVADYSPLEFYQNYVRRGVPAVIVDSRRRQSADFQARNRSLMKAVGERAEESGGMVHNFDLGEIVTKCASLSFHRLFGV
jgi:hypothetical protein